MSRPSIADNKDSSRDVILLDDEDDEDPPHDKKKQVKKVQDEPKNNTLDISVDEDNKWEGRGRSHHRKGHHNMGSDPKGKGKVKAGDMMVKTTSQVLHPLYPSRHDADDCRRDPSSLPSIRITLPSAISCAPARVNVAPKTPIASLQCDTCTSKNRKCIPVPGQACCSCHDSKIKCNFTRKHGCSKSKVAGSSQSGTNTDTTQLDADDNADEGSERFESPSPPPKARRMSPPGVSTWSKSRARTAPIAQAQEKDAEEVQPLPAKRPHKSAKPVVRASADSEATTVYVESARNKTHMVQGKMTQSKSFIPWGDTRYQ